MYITVVPFPVDCTAIISSIKKFQIFYHTLLLLLYLRLFFFRPARVLCIHDIHTFMYCTLTCHVCRRRSKIISTASSFVVYPVNFAGLCSNDS